MQKTLRKTLQKTLASLKMSAESAEVNEDRVNLQSAVATAQNAPPIALDLPSLTQAIAGAIREELAPHLQQQQDQAAHIQGLLEKNHDHRPFDDEDEFIGGRSRHPNLRTDVRTDRGAAADLRRCPSTGSSQSLPAMVMPSSGDFSSIPVANIGPKKPSGPFWDYEDAEAIKARWDGYRDLEAAVQSEATPKDKSIKVQAKDLFSQMKLIEKAMKLACIEGSGTLPIMIEVHDSMTHRAEVLKAAHKFGWSTASVYNDKVTGGDDSFLRQCHEIAEKEKEAKKKEREKDRERDRSRSRLRSSTGGNSFNSSPYWPSFNGSPRTYGRTNLPTGYQFPQPQPQFYGGHPGNYSGNFHNMGAPATVTSGAYRPPFTYKAPDKGYGGTDRRPGQCDLCHEYGHYARSCTSRTNEK